MDRSAKFYVLEHVTHEPAKNDEFRMGNAAVLDCGLCGEVIDGTGGGQPVVCQRCGDLLKRGELKTAVQWPETSE